MTPDCPGAGDSYPGCRRRRSRPTPATSSRLRSRPAHAASRRKGRDERRAGLADAASNALMGSSLAVPQGTRSHPQPREAACHHTTFAHILNTSDVVLPGSLWRLAQLSVQQRLSPVLPRGPPFGPLIGLLTPIALVRAPTNLRRDAITLHDQLPRLLTTEAVPSVSRTSYGLSERSTASTRSSTWVAQAHTACL